jgi:hypothetical protein
MQSALKLRTTVQSGGRIQVDSSELAEGTPVELIVLPDLAADISGQSTTTGIWDWLQSLPPSNLSHEDWERIESEMRREKEAWDN